MKFAAIGLLTLSCATNPQSNLAGYFADDVIHAPMELLMEATEFLKLCDEFDKHCNVYNLTLVWADSIPGNRVGQCEIVWTGPYVTQKITIQKNMPAWKTRFVVMHEMTHCTRFVGHTKTDEPHIMRPSVMDNEERTMKSDYEWFKEMFAFEVPMGE